jgi:hypothetical protein
VPFEARALVPLGDHPQAAHPAFDDAAEPDLTLFDVADDSLPTEELAAALVRKSRRPIWLRLGPQDRDPGTFLVSLATSAARLGAANVTLELMRAKPGPVYGWPSLFAGLGAELGGRLNYADALVLEHVQHAWDRTATFTLLSTELLPALAGAVPCVLVACGSPPPARRAGAAVHARPRDAAQGSRLAAPGRRGRRGDLHVPRAR